MTVCHALPDVSAPALQSPTHTTRNHLDAEFVLYRLEEAGRTLLALPNTGPTTHLRTTRHDVVQSAVEAYGWSQRLFENSCGAVRWLIHPMDVDQ